MAGFDREVSAEQRAGSDAPDQAAVPPEGMWRPRRIAAFGIRASAIGGPILVGTLTAWLVSQLFDSTTSLWLVSTVSLGSAIAVSVVLARLAARLLPLALLLRMTMLFPDRAPNRLKVARRATSRDELTRRLADPDADVREAATTLLALVTALGRHDRKTRGHSERVRLYCDLIGTELGLTEGERGRLRWVGLLHDIGKLEVATAVLNKPGKLTGTEWESVRTHPANGAKLAAPLADWLGPWFAGIKQHHEHFDGSGYPKGLAGEHISLAGRAVAVVDAFETMTAARSYKSPMTTAAARAELARCAGTHFDPNVVRAFLTIALPRLLWTMGPLTFLVNFPFLRWIPTVSVRTADVAAVGVNTAVGAVGVTAVTVAAATAHVPLIHSHGPAPARAAMAVEARQFGSTVPGQTGTTGPGTGQGPSTVLVPNLPGTSVDTAGGTDPGTADPDGAQTGSDTAPSTGSGSGPTGSGSSGAGSTGSGSTGTSGGGSTATSPSSAPLSGTGPVQAPATSMPSSTGSSGPGGGTSGSGTSGSGTSGTSGSGTSGTSGAGTSGSGTSGTSGSGTSGSGTSGSGTSGTSGSGTFTGTSGSGTSGSGTSGGGTSSTSGTSGGLVGGLLGGVLGLLSRKPLG